MIRASARNNTHFMNTETVSTDTLLRQLHWRYATKKFNPAKKITRWLIGR